MVSDVFPKTAKVYHCSECLRAAEAWYAAHPRWLYFWKSDFSNDG